MGVAQVVSKGASMIGSTLSKATSGIVAGSEKVLASGKVGKIAKGAAKGTAKGAGTVLSGAGGLLMGATKGAGSAIGSLVGNAGSNGLLKMGGIAGILALLSSDKLMGALTNCLGNVGDGFKSMGDAKKTQAETASALSTSTGSNSSSKTLDVSDTLHTQSNNVKALETSMSGSTTPTLGSSSGISGVESLGHQQYTDNLVTNSQTLLDKQPSLSTDLTKSTSKSATQQAKTDEGIER